MSARDLKLVIDIPNRRLIRDFFSNLEILPRALMQGDSYNLQIIGVEPSPLGDPTRPWRYVSLPTSFYLGIGDVGAAPTLGTFTLTFGADTTAALAYNATAAQVASALNALASIVSAGGVSVTGPDSGPYQIVFTSVGTRTAITGNSDLLYPLSSIQVYEARAGSVSVNEIQVVVLDRQPAALAETFTALAAPGITISTLQGGGSGVPEIQKIALDAITHDGTFTLTFSGQTTAAIAWNATAAEVQEALEALSNIAPADVVVTGQFPEFVVTFGGALTGNQPEMTASATGLIGPTGIEGTLSLNTAGIEQLLGGEASVETTLELAATISGSPVTLYQGAVTLKNDQIPNAPQSGTGLPSYYTAAEADDEFAHQTGDSIADIAADASTAHALNATFSDTEVEAALNALGTKLNSVCTKINDILTKLESAALLTP